jgi:hypothetical protein
MAVLDFNERWSSFLRKRAQRLRTSEKEAAKPVASLYLDALKEKAERLGVSIEKIKHLPHKNPPAYPTTECIMPTELVEFLNGEEFSESTIWHLEHCPACCALIDMASPSEDRLKELMEELRVRVGETVVRSEASMSRIFESTREC